VSEKSDSKKDGLYAVVNGVEYQISNVFSSSFGAGENVFRGLIDSKFMRIVKDVDGTFYLEYGGYPDPDFQTDLWKRIVGYHRIPGAEDRIRFEGDADFCVFKAGTLDEIEKIANGNREDYRQLNFMNIYVLFRTADMTIIGVRRVDPHLTAIDGASRQEL